MGLIKAKNMKKRTEETTVIYREIELVITVIITGEYSSATYYEPEEYPDVQITSIRVSDSEVNIIELFSDDDLDMIYELLEN